MATQPWSGADMNMKNLRTRLVIIAVLLSPAVIGVIIATVFIVAFRGGF